MGVNGKKRQRLKRQRLKRERREREERSYQAHKGFLDNAIAQLEELIEREKAKELEARA